VAQTPLARFTGLLDGIMPKNSEKAGFSDVFFFTSAGLSRIIGLTGRVRNISASFCFIKTPRMDGRYAKFSSKIKPRA
jgi:hypothetical protein